MSTLTRPSNYTTLIGVTDEPLWEFGDHTEYGHEVYTAGDCWALAWHIAKITGGRLHTLGWPDWHHVVVEVRPGAFMDVEGIHTAEEIEKAWFDLPLVPMPPEKTTSLAVYTKALDTGFVYLHGHGEAAEMARLVVAKHL